MDNRFPKRQADNLLDNRNWMYMCTGIYNNTEVVILPEEKPFRPPFLPFLQVWEVTLQLLKQIKNDFW